MATTDELDTYFLVTLDSVTRGRLLEIADEAGVDPCTLAAALLHDILEDDARMHCDSALTVTIQ